MIVLIRHGRTQWNEQGRMQGRSDIPLSAAGREAVRGWRIPASWAGARWLSSPLCRATETAALLSAQPVALEPRLIEMDWGAWEGRTLASLRTDAAMAANEARGLDFRPEGGESPREVRERVASLLAALCDDVVCVTHKGVIRAALSLATGWEMTSKPPLRLAHDAALVLQRNHDCRLELGGTPRLCLRGSSEMRGFSPEPPSE